MAIDFKRLSLFFIDGDCEVDPHWEFKLLEFKG